MSGHIFNYTVSFNRTSEDDADLSEFPLSTLLALVKHCLDQVLKVNNEFHCSLTSIVGRILDDGIETETKVSNLLSAIQRHKVVIVRSTVVEFIIHNIEMARSLYLVTSQDNFHCFLNCDTSLSQLKMILLNLISAMNSGVAMLLSSIFSA